MSHAAVPVVSMSVTPPAAHSLHLDDRERAILGSQSVAWCIILGLPSLGFLATVSVGLPLFAALMIACLLLGTTLTCSRAIATFTSKTLRLLVTARLVLIVVLGALLLLLSGVVWMALVSTVLLWLVADRLLGRRALFDLWKLTRKSSPHPPVE